MENEFKEILLATKIPNIDLLLEFLQNSDFFIAPASTKYHDSKPRGLLEHSMNVCRILEDKVYNYNKTHPENAISCTSVHLVALLHDVCKVNYYKLEYRNVKDETTRRTMGEKAILYCRRYFSLWSW